MMFSNKAGDRARFFHEMARLAGAGVSVSRAAAVMGGNRRSGPETAAAASLAKGLGEGKTISEALAPGLSALEFSIVDAAERGGRLVHGFRHLEEYHHLLSQTFTRMRLAAAYPVLMLHAAVLLPALVTAVLAGKKAGPAALAVLAHLLMLWGVLALAVLVWRALLRKSAVSPGADAFLRRLPMAGPAREALALARWSAVVHFQVVSGQRLSDGLRRAGGASESAGLRLASGRAAKTIEAGGEVGPALDAEPVFPRELSGALAAAEFTGTLDTETLQQSRHWMSESGLRLESASRWLSGAFYGLVMLFTAIQIVKLAGGYFRMYAGIMKDLGL